MKQLLSLVSAIRLIPHCFFALLFKSICLEDVRVAIRHRNLVYSDFFLFDFIYLMTWDKTFRNIFYFRIGRWKYLIQWLCPPHNCFIVGTYAKIGPGLLGIHPIGSIINAHRVGKNFVIKNNSTIGENGADEKPTIGDNVLINVNSVVFGEITIGDNVVIGAGTILYKSVPSNCTVVGNPARIVKLEGKSVNIVL